MSMHFFIIQLECLGDFKLLKEHLEELEYTFTEDEEKKTLTLNSIGAFQFVEQFCETFDIRFTFWIAIRN